MEFRILGPLEVFEDGRALDLGGAKQRAALAVLALHANRVVPRDQLIEALWDEEPTESAGKALQGYVSQLRKVLGRERLETKPPGYLLRLEPEELDAARFELLHDGGDPEAALALWRGDPLADFADKRFARGEIVRLQELRVSCIEQRIERGLAEGRHSELVGELEALTRAHPLREHLRAQLMLALYRAGRQTEALEAYHVARNALVEELGIDPGPRLRELHQQILTQDPVLDPPVQQAVAEPPVPSSPPPAPAAPVRPVADRTVSATCTSCGVALPATARFCPSCGSPVETEGGEMLKLVSVLFADVVSSTERAEALDPEETRAVLGDFFAAMSAEIHAEGGAIEKYIGDAIMAVFGVPAAHEDDALRAVRAARRMLKRLASWNEESAADYRIRIGINTGEVLASGAAGSDLMVIGDAVNVAARLEREAPVGSILVGERTAHAVRRTFELKDVGPLELRGKSQPVHAWLVERELDTPAPEGVSGLIAPMMGREVELGLLQMLFGQARVSASPQLVTIVGDAGIGKSRLTRELCDLVGEEAEVLVGRCVAYGDGVTLWPLAEILKARGGILETDTTEEVLEKIGALVRVAVLPGLAERPERTVAALAATMGLLPPEGTSEQVDPRDARRDLRAAWRALLASLAAERPVVVVIEDIHWADATMLEMIEDLASHVEGPVLFLTTARSEALHARPEWGGGLSNYSALRLNPLPAEASLRMLAHLLASDELAASAAVLDKAEGNPFFLEEILRGLVDTNRMRIEDGRLRTNDGFRDLEIPDTVQAVILARLDLLGAVEKRALQLAAVIGRTFWRGAVARVTARDDLDDILTVLQTRGLIQERLSSTVGGEVEYTFRHALIQEVAYESVPRRERARAHTEAAHWIEATAGPRRDELAELLAHHYVTAHGISGDAELRWAARSYCLIAAHSAFRRFAIEKAETFAWLAVDLSLPGTERVAALGSLGDLYAVTLRGDAAWLAYVDAIREVEAIGAGDEEALASLAARAAILFTRRQPTMVDPPDRSEAERVVDLGLAASNGSTRERAELLAAKSYVITLAPDWDAGHDAAGEEAARTAVAIAEQIGDANLISSVIDGVGLRLQAMARYGEIYARNQRRLELVPSLTDASEICDAHVTGAWTSVLTWRYRDGLEHATRCIDVARGVDEGQYIHGLVWRMSAAFRSGDWDRALADQSEIERHVREKASGALPPFATHAYATALLCLHLRGDEDAALAYEELLRQFNDGDEGGRGLNAGRAVTARALVHGGRVDAAERLLARVAGRDRLFYEEAHADLLVAQGRWEEAAMFAVELRAQALRTGGLGLPFAADRLEGAAAAARGDSDVAGELLLRAADGFDRLEAPWEAARSRVLLGTALEDDVALERALDAFERLGAVLDATSCRARLADVAS